MKRTHFLLILLALAFTSCSKVPKTKIIIPEVSQGTVQVVYATPDQMSSSEADNVIYSGSFSNGEAEISFDSVNFDKPLNECALVITSKDNTFSVNLPLPLQKGKTITVKVTGVEEYKKGAKINVAYSGSKHAESFSNFFSQIQDVLLSYARTPADKLDNVYKKEVAIYKNYIGQWPESGFPYMLLMSQITQISFDKTNPLLDYCSTLCSKTSENNTWKNKFCSLLSEKKLNSSLGQKLVVNGQDASGKVFSERDFHGNLILVDFWATWCKPCQEEIPHLKSLYSTYKGKGLTIVSISIGDKADEWHTFMAKNSFAWLSLLGEGKEITQRYDFQYIPFNLLCDQNGAVLKKNIHGAELDSFIKDYFAKQDNASK
jgi:Thiol-disulfide isomerase and thioredoxins